MISGYGIDIDGRADTDAICGYNGYGFLKGLTDTDMFIESADISTYPIRGYIRNFFTFYIFLKFFLS